MNKLLKVTAVIISAGVFSGCSFTMQVNPIDASIPVPMEPFDNTHSFAFNIANQTDLTKDYAFGGRIYKSPLRDFTQSEITSDKAEVDKKLHVGQPDRVLGGANMLSGKLISVINVVGGGVASLSWNADRHPATTSRWFVSVDASKYGNETEAKIDIVNHIKNAILEELKKYGKPINEVKKGQFTLYQFDTSYTIVAGGGHHTNLLDKNIEPLVKQMVNFGDSKLSSYSVGFRGAYNYDKIIYPMYLGIFLKKDIVGDDTYDAFMKRVTKKLPENYFLYQPSYPKFSYEGKNYVQTSITVPAIYTYGKRYDFIQPE